MNMPRVAWSMFFETARTQKARKSALWPRKTLFFEKLSKTQFLWKKSLKSCYPEENRTMPQRSRLVTRLFRNWDRENPKREPFGAINCFRKKIAHCNKNNFVKICQLQKRWFTAGIECITVWLVKHTLTLRAQKKTKSHERAQDGFKKFS